MNGSVVNVVCFQQVCYEWVCCERVCFEWEPKITFFKEYSRKYIKIIHQLVDHVYSLVPIAMADHRLARQIIACQS